jgi:hypothetical protein
MLVVMPHIIESHFIYFLQELETDQVLKQLKYIQMVCLSTLLITDGHFIGARKV